MGRAALAVSLAAPGESLSAPGESLSAAGGVNFFFFGPLCHAPLLALVLGHAVAPEVAVLPGRAVFWAEGQAFPLIVPDAGGRALGVLLRDLDPQDIARLEFYAGSFAELSSEVAVEVGAEVARARLFVPDQAAWQLGRRWLLADWQAQFGAAAVAAAGDFMAQFGLKPGGEVRARYAALLARGASWVRASDADAGVLRHRAGPQDVAVLAQREPYARFFAVEEYDLRFRRFDGTLSREVLRAAFISADAVTVLPYDPLRDRVLLIEQFRVGPFARGDRQPWQVEVIAGRIDAGESPEAAARREAVEEAGLHLGALLPVASYYPSTAAVSEYLYSYVGLCDLPDGVAGVFGVAHEAEDIRGHLISFDALMALLSSGEVANAPLILTALWLQRERPRLRGLAGAGPA